ncbi:Retrovirus-related Pol polyprotein from transposon TNT 1-94 [Vitis vinifera]|uniref:Retrovirus-related Pol polyprotein from transposon TNT 1-94 n=1 Tax=Vitis vinifera TaxID=29760 RepID=A0A438EHS3_VITVI|nr:Retrovirus-related Pol polyprotein from transposon TNT 1-94 [Vitis vinifera]
MEGENSSSLGCMDIDYAIRKDEPHKITDTSTPEQILLYERWEKSNRLSVMYIKTKISAGIRGSIEQHENVRELLKAIEEQFVTSDKALASTLIMKFTSLKLTGESAMLVTQRKGKKGKSQASQKGKQQIPPKSDIKKDEKWYAKPRKPVTSEQFILSGNKMGSHVEAIGTYRGGEYYGRYLEDGQSPGPFAKFLQEHGIVAQYTMPGSPDQNGVAERRNRTLLDMVRSMLSSSKLPKFLWTEALKTAVYILNEFQPRTGPKDISGYFIGYAEKSKGTDLLSIYSTRIVESRNAKFLEYDLVSGSDQFRNIVSDIDHTESQPSTSSDRLFIVHNTPQVQSGVERTITEVQPVVEFHKLLTTFQ